MPIPLAMMIPFMAAQSMVMGDAFGRSYQYGKRKISAMTNDEFNNFTKQEMMEQILREYVDIIPPLNQAIDDSTKLQGHIVETMLKLLPELVSSIGGDIIETTKEIIETGIKSPGKAGGGPSSAAIAADRITPELAAKLRLQYHTNIERLQHLLKNTEIALKAKQNQVRTSFRGGREIRTMIDPHGAAKLSTTITNLKTEIATQKKWLANVNQGRQPY